jgi:hypothetical protein
MATTKTVALRVVEAFIAHQFQAIHYTGCDGYPAALVADVVIVKDNQGREWALPNVRYVDTEEGRFPVELYNAQEMLAKVEAKGFIRPELWNMLEPRESLEEILEAEWWREQEDRMGWAA